MHSGSFGRLLPRSLFGQNEIASLLFYIPSLYHSSIEKHTHTRARQLSESMPAITCVFSLRDGSLFFSVSPAIRNAFLDFDRLFVFSALVRRKKLFFFVFFFFAFVREKKKKKTEKRRRNLDLRHRFSLVEVPSLRVLSVRRRSVGSGEISLFVEILNPLEFPLSQLSKRQAQKTK